MRIPSHPATPFRTCARKSLQCPGRALAIAAFLIMAFSGGVHAAVTAEPSSLTFTSVGEQKAITLTQDGEPLPASSIGSLQALASEHNYSFMFDFEKRDGELLVATNEETEVGSYELVIQTPDEPVSVMLYTPLSSLQNMLEQRAEEQGVPVDEVKRELGLATAPPRTRVAIELPPVVYVGRTLRLDMDGTPNHVHVWRINGDIELEGPGEHRFEYTFAEPGEYTLHYREESPDGNVLGEAHAATNVTEGPAIPWEVPAGVEVSASGPAGFGAFTWTLDGQSAGTGQHFAHTFPDAGSYRLVCRAESPENPEQSAYAFRVVVYDVQVVPRAEWVQRSQE